ncbi:MAG TPA: hypothetical protein VLT85_06995, partial [Terriglobales bacterium]|nr:hypothetical protein [Terriglobales bacterium]
DFAKAVVLADSRRPVAKEFQPGIGPFGEPEAVQLAMKELEQAEPSRYRERYRLGVKYPSIPRQKCDLCLGSTPNWEWAIEVKLFRMLGDNGKSNDNMLMHILSPYPKHRSALTDCTKLLKSGLSGRKAVLIYGFESADWPVEQTLGAFEVLARAHVRLGDRAAAQFSGLVHPIHRHGCVCAWEVSDRVEGHLG